MFFNTQENFVKMRFGDNIRYRLAGSKIVFSLPAQYFAKHMSYKIGG